MHPCTHFSSKILRVVLLSNKDVSHFFPKHTHTHTHTHLQRTRRVLLFSQGKPCSVIPQALEEDEALVKRMDRIFKTWLPEEQGDDPDSVFVQIHQVFFSRDTWRTRALKADDENLEMLMFTAREMAKEMNQKKRFERDHKSAQDLGSSLIESMQFEDSQEFQLRLLKSSSFAVVRLLRLISPSIYQQVLMRAAKAAPGM